MKDIEALERVQGSVRRKTSNAIHMEVCKQQTSGEVRCSIASEQLHAGLCDKAVKQHEKNKNPVKMDLYFQEQL